MNFLRSVIIAEFWRPEVTRLGKSLFLRGQPRQCTHSAPDFTQIGSLSAELGLYPITWTPSEIAPKWIQYFSEA